MELVFRLPMAVDVVDDLYFEFTLAMSRQMRVECLDLCLVSLSIFVFAEVVLVVVHTEPEVVGLSHVL